MSSKSRILEMAASLKRMADDLAELAKEDDKEEGDEDSSDEKDSSSRGMAIAMLKKRMSD